METCDEALTRVEQNRNYGLDSDEYLQSILALAEYCDTQYIAYFPTIAHIIKNNEIIIRHKFGLDSQEYLKVIKMLDRLCEGKYGDSMNFDLYSNDIISVIKIIEENISNTYKNKKPFLCIVTSLYLDITPDAKKALRYGTELFSLVRDSKNPLNDDMYRFAVQQLMAAYELNGEKDIYLKWVYNYINQYSMTDDLDHCPLSIGSNIIVCLENIRTDKFPELTKLLLTQFVSLKLNLEMLYDVLYNWGFNQCYKNIEIFENIILININNPDKISSAYGSIGAGLYDLGPDGFEKSLFYFEKAWNVYSDPLDKFVSGFRIMRTIHESPDTFNIKNSILWANKLVNHFYEYINKFEGDNNYIIIHILEYITNLYCDLGQYSEAIRIQNKVLKVFNNYFQSNPESYSIGLGNIGDYYSYIGDYKSAKKFIEMTLRLREEKNLDRDPILLHNLAHCYSSLGDDFTAIEIEKEVIEIMKSNMLKYENYYSATLSRLADYYCHIEEYEKAINLGEEALEFADKTISKEHFHYMYLLYNTGFYYSDSDINKAKHLILQARELCLNMFGDKHPFYLESTLGLMLLYRKEGNVRELIETSINLGKAIFDYYSSSFLFLPNEERQLFLNNEDNRWLNIFLQNNAYTFKDPALISTAYDACLLSKGLLLNSEIEFNKFLTEINSTELNKKFNEIKLNQQLLNKLYTVPILERNIDVDSLENITKELERDLLIKSKEEGVYFQKLSINSKDIRKQLKREDAAIEFISLPLTKDNESILYLAYILKNEVETPILVELFEENELRQLLDEENKIVKNLEVTISKLVWERLSPYLKDIKNIYFAPDGLFHQIAIEYLPDFDRNGMIFDRWNLHRLSSTREIAFERNCIPTKDAVIYGGIKYDTALETLVSESRKFNHNASRGYSVYYNLADSLSLRTGVKYLKYTLKEAETINNLMNEYKISPIFISGNAASEESFKDMSGTIKGILHIATHGFYWSEKDVEKRLQNNDILKFMNRMQNLECSNMEDKALTRSGLFMAGANNALLGIQLPQDVDDGILTAQEIASLDFRGLDLVVLSACQTGMGDISSDGVFGLQRGFKKAGANSILMSLWNVDDEATQILMTEFYRNYLSGKSKQESLLKAQKILRETPGFEDPEYWAAFILLDGLN